MSWKVPEVLERLKYFAWYFMHSEWGSYDWLYEYS